MCCVTRGREGGRGEGGMDGGREGGMISMLYIF